MRQIFLTMMFLAGVIVVACTPPSAPNGRDAIAQSAAEAIAASCGRTIPVGVDWASFEESGAPAEAAIKASKLVFLTTALTDICLDAAASAALAAQIDQIELRQAAGAADGLVYIYERTLIVEYAWGADGAAPDPIFIRDEIIARLRGEAPEAP